MRSMAWRFFERASTKVVECACIAAAAAAEMTWVVDGVVSGDGGGREDREDREDIGRCSVWTVMFCWRMEGKK